MNRSKSTYPSDTFRSKDDQLANRRLGTRLVYLGVALPFCVISVIVVLAMIDGMNWELAATVIGLALLGSFTMMTIGLGVAVPESREFLMRVFETAVRSLPWRTSDKAVAEKPEEEEEPEPLPFQGAEPPAPEQGWMIARDARRAFLDVVGPAYILNQYFQFIDWNPTFEELVAKPLGLVRGCHAGDFVKELVNCDAVSNRANEVFDPDHYPLVDIEPLVFKTDPYGEVQFRKVAAQVSDEDGNIRAWTVYLDIITAERPDALWEDIQTIICREVTWSRYAVIYDKLLLEFDDYARLVEMVTGKLGDARRCLDLGAGTGNGSLMLLRGHPQREVWAVERNETMLECLRSNVQDAASAEGRDFCDRLRIIKEDMRRIGRFPKAYFDGALLINSLYSVENRSECLRQVSRTLKPGGILALSMPNSETDVDKLFAEIRAALERKNRFDDLKLIFEAARESHAEMDDLIHRDTKDQIREYIEEAGFVIEDWHEKEYADAVVVVKAIKQ